MKALELLIAVLAVTTARHHHHPSSHSARRLEEAEGSQSDLRAGHRNELGSHEVVRFYHASMYDFDHVNFARSGLVDVTRVLTGHGEDCTGDYESGELVNELAHGFYVFPTVCSAIYFGWGVTGSTSASFKIHVFEIPVVEFQSMDHADTGGCIMCDSFYVKNQCQKHLCFDYSSASMSSFSTQIVFRPTAAVMRSLRHVGHITIPHGYKFSTQLPDFQCRDEDRAIAKRVIGGEGVVPESVRLAELATHSGAAAKGLTWKVTHGKLPSGISAEYANLFKEMCDAI